MIAIINQNKRNKKGETLYYVRINKLYVTEFYHKRDYGLAECLRLASLAVKKHNTLCLLNNLKYKKEEI